VYTRIESNQLVSQPVKFLLYQLDACNLQAKTNDKILTAMHDSPGLLHCQEHGSPQNVRANSSDTPHLLITGDLTGFSYIR